MSAPLSHLNGGSRGIANETSRTHGTRREGSDTRHEAKAETRRGGRSEGRRRAGKRRKGAAARVSPRQRRLAPLEERDVGSGAVELRARRKRTTRSETPPRRGERES
jgi:hypothetical protein